MTEPPIHSADGSEASSRTPGGGATPEAEDIEPAIAEGFGPVRIRWDDGKGKTAPALGAGVRAAGHGHRIHVLRFVKGDASSVEDVRGECTAIGAMPGIATENAGHDGRHGLRDGTEADDRAARARGGFGRAREVLASRDDPEWVPPLDGSPEDGVRMPILDGRPYAANRDRTGPDVVVNPIAIEAKPERLELVLAGGDEKPAYVSGHADLVTNVRKGKRPFEAGHRARRGTEYP